MTQGTACSLGQHVHIPQMDTIQKHEEKKGRVCYYKSCNTQGGVAKLGEKNNDVPEVEMLHS